MPARLTSFCVVAVGSVVTGTEALPMVHHDGRQLKQESLSAWGGRGRGVTAAVRLHVQHLVEADMNPDFLPVVPARPSSQEENTQHASIVTST